MTRRRRSPSTPGTSRSSASSLRRPARRRRTSATTAWTEREMAPRAHGDRAVRGPHPAGAGGHLAMASVRWLDPGTREPHEESGQLETGSLDDDLWHSSYGLQVAATAAYFADDLRVNRAAGPRCRAGRTSAHSPTAPTHSRSAGRTRTYAARGGDPDGVRAARLRVGRGPRRPHGGACVRTVPATPSGPQPLRGTTRPGAAAGPYLSGPRPGHGPRPDHPCAHH